MGGSFQVDRVIQATAGAVDELSFQAEQKIKATANEFHYYAINGTSASSGTGYAAKTFDGLRKLLSGTSNEFLTTIDLSTAAALDSNYGAFLDELDALVHAVDGTPSVLMMNGDMLLKVRACARRAGYYERKKDDFGRIVESYGGIPMMDMGKYYNGTASVDAISTSAPSESAFGTSSIFAVTLGLDAFHGISPTGTGVINSYMADMNFNTAEGSVVERKLLILYLNTGTSQAPVWSVVGKRVEDSSMEYDWSEETKQDILGNTYTTMKKPKITQTFDPCELDSGDKAQVKIWNQAVRDQDVAAMTNNDLLVVHAYTGTAEGGAFAERYPSSAVRPTGLGGSANVGMPIEVTFGGERKTGTAKVTDGAVTFTAE